MLSGATLSRISGDPRRFLADLRRALVLGLVLLFAGATAVAAILLFTHPGPRRRVWWSLAALATAAMAWSRTYLQVHLLLDVTAGPILGVGVALMVFGGIQVLATRRYVGASRAE